MKKFVAVLSLVVVAAFATAALSTASTGRVSAGWSAKLTAAQEVPKQTVKNAAASGSFTATLSGRKLKWKLTFSKLTGPATAAHIHIGAMGKAGGVAVALCGPCKSGQSGTATLTAATIAKAGKHLLYVNVHTAKNPNGEIRGQIG